MFMKFVCNENQLVSQSIVSKRIRTGSYAKETTPLLVIHVFFIRKSCIRKHCSTTQKLRMFNTGFLRR